MKKIFLILAALMVLTWKAAQAQNIDCSNGFTTGAGPCGTYVTMNGAGNRDGAWWVVGSNAGTTPAISGSKMNLIPQNGNHVALSFMYQPSQVDATSFTSSFDFIPNGQFFSFHLNNSTNSPWGFNGKNFSQGANCENDFFQGYSQPTPPDNVFAIGFDSYSPLTQNGSFSYSGVQIYRSNPYVECPCLPAGSGSCGDNSNYVPITKISTAPVNLTTGSSNTTTGHTYSVSLAYDGDNLTLNMFDKTAGDGCPGSKCFTHTWTGVNIPASVDGDKAWIGFGGSTTSAPSKAPLYVTAASYSSGGGLPPQPSPTATSTSTPTPTMTATNTPNPTPSPSGNCSFTSPAGTARWQCQ